MYIERAGGPAQSGHGRKIMATPKHGVTNTAKLDQMIADMRAADGWPLGMPPVLVAGDNEALTGSHRLAAAHTQAVIDQLIDDGYDWTEIICMDDYELARTLRTIGRADLADLALPEHRCR